ncbi:methyltransferase family protein [Sphaerisporangium perillae]|uniref:methyltransferase family protein n=1 Tax=Sphaerisporangium perillae TaxID=2935860 RepID=UPI00200DE18D|nr:methyltransferase [Sphaerisporangium perillae]
MRLDAGIIRAVALMGPVAVLLVAARVRRPGESRVAAAILATAWNLLVLAVVNVVALRAGWWTFHAEGGLLAGVPADLLLGWAVLWGACPALAAPRAPVPLTAALPAWLDLALMPRAEPVVVLGSHWWAGEAAAIAFALVPGLLLARWTEERRLLPARAAFQVVLAGGLGLVAPVALTGVWRQPGWMLALAAQALAAPMVFGLAAVREFAVVGRGTPLPYDAPVRLVTGGPYAYVRNPMQVAMTAGYLLLAPLDPAFLAAAAVTFAYGAGLAAWHEGEQLERRFGGAWHDYRRRVRPWLPRLRPAMSPGMPPASLYVAATCGQCRQVGAWMVRHAPVALQVVPAESHPCGLRRITYEREDGVRTQGVAAVAHALTHIHLGWALAGWLLLLPGIGSFAQLCLDALGAGPRTYPTTRA